MADIQDNQMRELIVYLAANNRAEMLRLLNSHSIAINNPNNDREFITAIYNGIGTSTVFRNALKQIMIDLASKNSNVPAKLTINDFVSNGISIKNGFSNVTGTEEHDREDRGVTADQQTAKTGFSQTGVGSFLNTLFSKENLNKYIDTGITTIKNKQVLQANQQQIDAAALQLESQRMASGVGTAGAAVKSKPNWILPVVIGSVVLIGVIITVIIIKNKK